ncbi:MAG: GntR family transcriptional regulator [Anaerolineae bacterium]|nr:GntR family transcriptional regulator [Anaerolineae bacterium]
MVDKRSSVPLYLQIQSLIIEQIRAGELRPGDQVPSEPELAAQRQVSRMTARKALDGLVAKGILYRRKGKGTYVSDHVMAYSLSTILSFSRTFRANGHEVVTRVLSKEIVPASANVCERLGLIEPARVIAIRRLRRIDGLAAAIHTSFLSYPLFAPLLEIDLSENSLLDVIENISGTPVAYSRDSVLAALANPEEASLLDIEAGSPVLKVEGVAYTENGQPTRLTRAVYRADMFHLTVLNTAGQSALLDMAAAPERG